MSKVIFMPEFRPGDIVGFNNGDVFVISTIEYCSRYNGVWTYSLVGWHTLFNESQLYRFPHVVPGFRVELKNIE